MLKGFIAGEGGDVEIDDWQIRRHEQRDIFGSAVSVPPEYTASLRIRRDFRRIVMNGNTLDVFLFSREHWVWIKALVTEAHSGPDGSTIEMRSVGEIKITDNTDDLHAPEVDWRPLEMLPEDFYAL